MEVHATAAMVADVGTIKQMLLKIVPGLRKGKSVAQLQQPWPEAVQEPGRTGLWWDVD